MCRYTPACEEFVCDISREPEARGIYITNKLPNISRCIADIYTNWCTCIYKGVKPVVTMAT